MTILPPPTEPTFMQDVRRWFGFAFTWSTDPELLAMHYDALRSRYTIAIIDLLISRADKKEDAPELLQKIADTRQEFTLALDWIHNEGTRNRLLVALDRDSQYMKFEAEAGLEAVR